MRLSKPTPGHKVVFKRPRDPDAGDSGRGIDENAVHVEVRRGSNRSHRLGCFPLINILATSKQDYVWRNKEGWGGRRGLNPRHSVPQTDAHQLSYPTAGHHSSLRYFLTTEKDKSGAENHTECTASTANLNPKETDQRHFLL